MSLVVKELNWSDLRIFLAVFRRLSVRGASQVLGTSHSTVSRRLERLEEALGGLLFFRTTQGFVPTEMAHQLLDRAEKVESEIFGVQRDLTGRDVDLAGPIRIATTPIVSQKLLIPMLAEFAEKYPKIDLELHSTYEVTDLARSHADVAIRFQDSPKPDLVGRRLPDFAESVYGDREYLKTHAFDGSKLPVHWIGWQRAYSEPDWQKNFSVADCPIRHDIFDPQDQLEAVRSGLGIALLPCFVGDADPNLERVAKAGVLRKRSGWILTHPELRASQRVQTCIRFLVEGFQRRADLISGQLMSC